MLGLIVASRAGLATAAAEVTDSSRAESLAAVPSKTQVSTKKPGVLRTGMLVRDAEALSPDPPGDCNANGIPDSLDLAHSMEDDVNHNAIIDYCDPDSIVRARNNRSQGEWRAAQALADSSHFRARHRWWGLSIRYTVPDGGRKVQLAILDEQGTVVAPLLARWDSCGAYEFEWDKRDRVGEVVRPGTYVVRLTVGARSYLQRLTWL